MADVTTAADRTSRIAILDGTDYIFTMVGTAVSGPLFKWERKANSSFFPNFF